jgi:iron complex outermembrane receptor protein
VLFGPDGLQVYSYTGLDFSDEQFSWRVGLDYTTDSEALLYASVSRGFKSGGFNAAFLSFDPAESAIQAQPYDSEFTTAYELGYKAELADGRLRLNAALFYNDFEDLQVFTFTNTGSLPVSVLDNASAADVMGLELDAIWYPTDSLLVNVSAAFMDSELKDFEAGGGEDLSGNSIAYTPRHRSPRWCGMTRVSVIWDRLLFRALRPTNRVSSLPPITRRCLSRRPIPWSALASAMRPSL